MCYDNDMQITPGSSSDNLRLREIASILQRAYAVAPIDPPVSPADFLMSDMLLALDNPELCDILREIKDLQLAQLQRLERLLSRYADNDT